MSEKTESTKLAKHVVEGDKIQMEDGSLATVKETRRGFLRYENDNERSVLIYHTQGWTQCRASEVIYLG